MPGIVELIQQLCPDGVVYKPLGEVFKTRNGYTPSKKNSEYWEPGGTVPWFRMEDIRENGRLLETPLQYVSESAVKRNGLMPKGSLIVATSATIGEHAMLMVDGLCNQRFTCLSVKQEYTELVSEKYVFYWGDVLDEFCKMNLNQGNFASVNMDAFNRCPFPVPPLEVQQEIVRILDAFTELEANLQRELAAREKQYGHYRDELVGSAGEVECLADFCTITRGKRFTKSDYVPEGIPSIHYGEIYTRFGLAASEAFSFVDTALADGLRYATTGDVVVASAGENKEDICKPLVWLGKERAAVHDDCFILAHDQNPLYLAEALSSSAVSAQKERLATEAKVTRISQGNLGKIRVPLPPREKQDEIADKLSAFPALIQNLQRQIELTHKQYEHYRDALLDLPRKVA